MASMPRIEYGSAEWIGHGLQVDGEPRTDDYEYADVPFGGQVNEWFDDLVVLDGLAGHMVGPGSAFEDAPPGLRQIQVRVPDSPETVVETAGYYVLLRNGDTVTPPVGVTYATFPQLEAVIALLGTREEMPAGTESLSAIATITSFVGSIVGLSGMFADHVAALNALSIRVDALENP